MFFIADGISFVQTLTRNVLCLWDEVSSPCQGNSSLFSQSDNEAVSRDISNIADLTNHDSASVPEYRITRPKPRRQLVFDRSDSCTSKHAGTVEKDRGKISDHDPSKETGPLSYNQALMNNLFSPRTLAERTNRYGGGVKRLYLILGLKNYTFPLFRPVVNFDSSLSSMMKALNLTGVSLKSNVKSDQPLLSLKDCNNNSFQRVPESDSLKKSVKDDTIEFEKDIKFLSTEPNKTSTPIKSISPNLKQRKAVSSYEHLAQNFLSSEPVARKNLLTMSSSASVAEKKLLTVSCSASATQKKILTVPKSAFVFQKNLLTANLPRVFHQERLSKTISNTVKSRTPFIRRNFECSNDNHHFNFRDQNFKSPKKLCHFSYNNLEPSSSVAYTDRRTPTFSSEDEEAVYYLLTKYLND